MAGSISSAGIGSGLDVKSIISSLMDVEKVPLTKLQNTGTAFQTKLSAFGQVQSLVSSLNDAIAPLTKPATFGLLTTSTSDATSVTASANPTAVAGNYTVGVSTLAATQSTVSASGQFTDASSPVGTGTITIQLGSWNADQTGFTPKDGVGAIAIPIGASESTLGAIRDKINGANAGVSATLINDATGARLAFQSTRTGAENGFRVQVAADAPAASAATGVPDPTAAPATGEQGLARLAFDPPGGTTGTVRSQAAADTEATINGIAVKTSGTTLTNVVDGLTFTATKITTSPVTVTVARDTASVKDQLGKFVEAYNGLVNFLASSTAYDPSTKSGALLQGDALATSLQNQLRSIVGAGGQASSAFGSLSSVGVEFQRDGTIKLNDTKVAAALTKLPELTKAFTASDTGDTGKNGFATRIAGWAKGLLASNGTLPGKAKSIQSQIAANQKDQQSFNDRLTTIQARIQAQYSALDSTISNANALQKLVTQQITTWNKGNN